jgi:hypothetical protein
MVPGQKPFGKEAFTAGSEAQKEYWMEGSSDIEEFRASKTPATGRRMSISAFAIGTS